MKLSPGVLNKIVGCRAVFQFQGNLICSKAVGVDFNEFCNQFSDDERAFGFIRIQVTQVFCCVFQELYYDQLVCFI